MSCDRVAGVTENGNDLWYSGKGHRFAGDVPFVAAPDGAPLWVSDVEPGSFHDLRAARPDRVGTASLYLNDTSRPDPRVASER